MVYLSLRAKVVSGAVLLGVLPLIINAAIGVSTTSTMATELTADRLSSVRTLKKHQLETLFHDMVASARSQANSRLVRSALRDFSAAAEALATTDTTVDTAALNARYAYQQQNTPGAPEGSAQRWAQIDETGRRMQHLFISTNPHPIGQKENLDTAGDSRYSQTHAVYHPTLRKYLREHAYYDIFLVNPEGRVVYTVFKEVDFATNLRTGPYANTGLGRAFAAAMAAPDADFTHLDDFAPYEPSYNAAAMFLSAPVYDDTGRSKLGAFIVQVPVDKIFTLMSDRTGLGATGEVYLVGDDDRLRSNLPLSGTKVLEALTGPNMALADGAPRVHRTTDAQGRDVFSASEAVSVGGFRWRVMAEQTSAEALAPLHAFERNILALGCLMVLGIGALGWWVARRMTGPILEVTHALRRLADGDLTATVTVRSHDEIGQLATSFDTFRTTAVAKKKADDERAEADRRKLAVAERVGAAVLEIGHALNDITAGNQNLAERTEAQAANVQETTATMNLITERVSQSAHSAAEALGLVDSAQHAARRGQDVVQQAMSAMSDINASSKKIADIIGVIDEIAFQTNLLALNAAVEAARAGEQGRGFAVVAGEVRALAGRSASAAKEIKNLISTSVKTVQQGAAQVEQTNASLHGIVQGVTRVAETVRAISAAAQEQSVSISEINRAIAQMDTFTQQNASLVEEAAGASQALQEQVKTVVQTIQSA
jgi:methyl-accepting chemotaxis protein